MITALSYIGICSDNTEDWRQFGQKILGMQLLDSGGRNMAFRMDDQAQRLIIANEPGDTISFIGWEVAEHGCLDKLASRLEDAGYAVTTGSRAVCDRRLVSDMIICTDPAGYRVEIVYNPVKVDDPFIPGRPISGFKTGPYGMGHAVLHVADAHTVLPFYTDILGFKLSDYGLTPVPLYFFHVNGRHHSFAIVGSGRQGFHHFMVEYDNLDDVGQGYDLALTGMAEIAYTLGRHTNDYITSYYAHTPSGFFVESGWGGRIIDPDSWQPHETDIGPSFWGHDRLHLPSDLRDAFEQKRLDTAAKGHRTPHISNCPWLYHQLEDGR
ncbi:MAG: VOC family protein [Candidatus Puniceispirillaceae bacterium]